MPFGIQKYRNAKCNRNTNINYNSMLVFLTELLFLSVGRSPQPGLDTRKTKVTICYL